MKRFVSLLLALSVALSVFTLPVFADSYSVDSYRDNCYKQSSDSFAVPFDLSNLEYILLSYQSEIILICYDIALCDSSFDYLFTWRSGQLQACKTSDNHSYSNSVFDRWYVINSDYSFSRSNGSWFSLSFDSESSMLNSILATNSRIIRGENFSDILISSPFATCEFVNAMNLGAWRYADVPEGEEHDYTGLFGSVIEAVDNIASSIINGISSLFIPSDGFFQDWAERTFAGSTPALFTQIVTLINGVLGTLGNINSNPPEFTFTYHNVTYNILDFEPFEAYIPIVQNVIVFIMWFVYLMKLAHQLPGLIGNVGSYFQYEERQNKSTSRRG